MNLHLRAFAHVVHTATYPWVGHMALALTGHCQISQLPQGRGETVG